METEVRRRGNSLDIYVNDESGGSIGEMNCAIYDGAINISMVIVYSKHKNKGYGLRLYTELMEEARNQRMDVRSDTVVKSGAANIYAALRKRGYDVRKNPDARTDEDGCMTGHGRPVFTIRIR